MYIEIDKKIDRSIKVEFNKPEFQKKKILKEYKDNLH